MKVNKFYVNKIYCNLNLIKIEREKNKMFFSTLSLLHKITKKKKIK